MPKFTIEQESAITMAGSNIIVSAGAGSGKTAVLTERVIRKLKNGIDINKILVLTFTKEAANEMKDRIRNSMKKESLTEQLDYIDSAYITTFDSYALSIVKKYHYLLNVSNNVSIIDGSLMSVIKSSKMDEVFDSLYGDKEFEKFISKYTVKDDTSIKKLLIRLSSKMDLLIDKETYLKNYISNYYSIENINELAVLFEDYILKLVKEINNLVDYLGSLSTPEYASSLMLAFDNLINSKTYDEVYQNISIEIPRLPRGSEDIAKETRKELKNALDSLVEIVRFKNIGEIKTSILETKDYASVIVKIISEFDRKVSEYKYSCDKFEFLDIAKLAIKVVKENEEIRKELKEFYHEIMIDEYQDTNDLQEEFVKLIENNNVYVVGDIKQSIYRFRNANPNIFRDKYIKYQNNDGGIKIDLLKNFRSRREVIDDINKMFNRIMDLSYGDADYERSHQMVFGNTSYEEGGKNSYINGLKVLTYEDVDDGFTKEETEAFIIGNDIKNKMSSKYQIMDKESGKLRNLEYSDICIIIDRSTTFELYKKIFEYLQIPLTLFKDEALSEQEDMYLLKNAIGAIICIKTKDLGTEFKYYMTSLMRSFFFGYNDEEIFECFSNNSFKETETYTKLERISKYIDYSSVYEITNMIYKEFNVYEKCLTKTNISAAFVRYEYMLNLATSLTENGYTIYEYKNYLDDMINDDIDIRYPVNTRGTNSVKIMTIHKSKGLEFPVCYFSGFYKQFNKADLKDMFLFDNDFGIILPNISEHVESTCVKDLLVNKYNKEEISEKIRLLYVALTRAREDMIIVIPENDHEYSSSYVVSDSERKKYRSFLSMIDSIKNTLKPNTIHVSDLSFLTSAYEDITSVERSIKDSSLEVSHLNNDIEYVETSENRFSKHDISIVTKETKKNMEYGLNVHYVLETEDFNTSNNEIVKSLLSKLGKLNNPIYYKEYEFIYNDGESIRHGIIDLMIETDDEIKIVDYKLSNIEDDAYLKQLNGYKKYIESISDKPVTIYLYSIVKNELKKI